MQEDFEDWVTKQEAAEQTGHSLRTLERLIQSKKIRQAYRKVPGRRPLTVLHPEDVKELKKDTLPAQPFSPQITTSTLPARILNGPTLELLTALNSRVAIKDKFFLSLKEAAELSGLSKAYLQKQITEKKLEALRDRGWKIRRSDLEKL